MCSGSESKRVKVIRVLCYEGDRHWVETVLTQSYISPLKPLITGSGSITEKKRIMRLVKELKENEKI